VVLVWVQPSRLIGNTSNLPIQGIADVAAPATVKVSFLIKARIPATLNLNPMLSGEIVKGTK